MNRPLLIILMFIGFLTCTPPVVFDRPYPIEGDDLAVIPDHYQGEYMCESDSTIIFIDDRLITARSEYEFQLPISSINEKEDCSIQGSEMYIEGRQECIPLVFMDDSTVIGTVIEFDTLFNMGTDQVARMYKGNVMISQLINEGEWSISLLSLEESRDLLYRAINDKTSVKHVKKITPAKDITRPGDKKSRYKIKPTMREFDELLKDEKIFIECEYLIRISLEHSVF